MRLLEHFLSYKRRNIKTLSFILVINMINEIFFNINNFFNTRFSFIVNYEIIIF